MFVRSARILQFIVCSSDREPRHLNSDVTVARSARPGYAGILVKLVPVRKGNWLQQSSAKGKAAIRLAADGSDLNPQASAGPKPQLRTLIL